MGGAVRRAAQGRMRDELQTQNSRWTAVEVRLDKEVNAVRTSLEANKNDIIRRAPRPLLGRKIRKKSKLNNIKRRWISRRKKNGFERVQAARGSKELWQASLHSDRVTSYE